MQLNSSEGKVTPAADKKKDCIARAVLPWKQKINSTQLYDPSVPNLWKTQEEYCCVCDGEGKAFLFFLQIAV